MKLLKLLSKVYRLLQWWIFGAAFIVAILAVIPFTNEYLVKWKILVPDASLGILAVMILIVVTCVTEVSRSASELSEKLNRVEVDRDHDIIPGGTNRIYDDIERELSSRPRAKKKIEVDVLGYTLFSIHRKLKAWKKSGILQSMTINMYHLDELFIEEHPQIDDGWIHDARKYPEEIRKFVEENTEFLEKNNVEIIVRAYRHIPAVHGFRIGDGSLYISFAIWDIDKRIIEEADQCTFERVNASDTSQHAQHLKEVYSNWVSMAKNDNLILETERDMVYKI